MAPASDFDASGAGLSLPRLPIALSTMPFGSPSFAGRSNRTVSTPALVRCAAICAPMTPAPSTAARRTSSLSDISHISLKNKIFSGGLSGQGGSGIRRSIAVIVRPWQKSALEARRREPDQLLRRLAPVAGVADARRALDQAEVGHGVGQRAGQEVQAPVQLLLAQLRDAGRDRPSEITQHVAVAFRQELAQAVVLLSIRPCDHPDEGAAAVAVLGEREG